MNMKNGSAEFKARRWVLAIAAALVVPGAYAEGESAAGAASPEAVQPASIEQSTAAVINEAKEAISQAQANSTAKAETPPPATLEAVDGTLESLIKTLVSGGVLSAEAAEKLVQDAREKAAKNAKPVESVKVVRVPYLPESTKAQMRDDIRNNLRSDVVHDVIEHAKTQQWGIANALPGWVNRIKLSGDFRVRGEASFFDNSNVDYDTFQYFDVVKANAGGDYTTGPINTQVDRQRLRERARLALDARVTDNVRATFRLTTGNTTDPVSTNQTLGNYGGRYSVVFDQSYLKYDFTNFEGYDFLSLLGGRMPNPFVGSELVWDADLNFEGVAATYRSPLKFGGGLYDMVENDQQFFLTVGAFPLQEVELSKKDKWLYGGQLGFEKTLLSQTKASVALGYYYFKNMTGQAQTTINEYQNRTSAFGAPGFEQRGNVFFDINNQVPLSADQRRSLYALAADYHELNLTGSVDWATFAPYHVVVTADYVKNLGYDEAAVRERTRGVCFRSGMVSVTRYDDCIAPKVYGYDVRVAVGWPHIAKYGDWRVTGEYRMLQRDAVLDAFADSDFRLGGTDSRGWILTGEYGLRDNTWLTVKWLTADAIDGERLGIDVLQVDLNAKF